jgi:hypothetical protein
MHLIPGPGNIAAMGVNATLNYIFTYKIGHALSNLFDKGGYDLLDVSSLIPKVLSLITPIPRLKEISDGSVGD